MTDQTNPPIDAFAQIATQFDERWQKALYEPKPPVLPERDLPAGRHNPKAVFRPAKKMSTPAQLDRELERMRKRFAPFMRDLAPAQEPMRGTLALDTFDWRLETAADRRGFATHTLPGKGRWEKVSIPHYGPPIGKAAAYYRTAFTLDAAMFARGSLHLCFKGVDYKAHVFVNGSYAGSHEGFFAPFEFDVSGLVRKGTNTLVVKVENDAIFGSNAAWQAAEEEGDKLYAATGPGWDDPELGWHHCPPGMGIYQDVYLEARAPVHIRDIFVRPLDATRAEVWVTVHNGTNRAADVAFDYSIHGQNFRKAVCRNVYQVPAMKHVPGFGDMPKPGDNEVRRLQAGSGSNTFTFEVTIPNARQWDTATPWLYQIQIALLAGGDSASCLDRRHRQFGMRIFRMEELEEPKGRCYLNGREVRLRGTNTMGNYQQCVMNKDWDQLRDDLLLAKICNLNYIRFTQRPVQPEIYDYCDRLGIMTQCDLPLFGNLRRNCFEEALRQCREMEELVRAHPCNVMVSYINEPFPNGDSKPHRNLDHEELRAFFAAADIVIHQANPDRVTKSVDGDYDPPSPGLPDRHCYNAWYGNHGIDLGRLHRGYWQRVKKGWRHACGEFGAEGLDPVPLMRAHYPKAWLPRNAREKHTWNPDSIRCAQTGRFHYLWYETPHSLEDWVRASHEHQAWAMRMVTEAFRRDERMVSCCIHLFIDAFPSSWMKTIIDFERRPKPAFFAYRDALAPLHAHWRSDRYVFYADEEICLEGWVCHDHDEKLKGLSLHYQLECGGKVLFAQKTRADVPRCGSAFQGHLRIKAPTVKRRTLATARIALVDAAGRVVHDSATALTLFPARPEANRTAYILGEARCASACTAKALGMRCRRKGPIRAGETILVDDMALFETREAEVLAAVEAGSVLVFNQLPAGTHEIAGRSVQVVPTGMGERHFVNRDTGHSIVAGFAANDFKFLIDEDCGHVTPFYDTCFFAEEFTPILTTGTGMSSGGWVPALAAAEMRCGEGAIRINQLTLHNRLSHPVMGWYALRLFT